MPTTFDETVALSGTVGEHVAIARKKGDMWYVGAMTNWTARDLELDFSFLGAGTYEAVIFRDGINADRDATDYKREVMRIIPGQKVKIQMAPGGGWAARLTPSK
jgi:alpha-glucosidase